MMRYANRSTYDIYERDRCATPRAGPLDCVDAVLPWRVVDDPPPPPVPPKREVSARAPVARAAEVPKRVTPWLHRRVKTPVCSQDAQVTRHHRLPEKASSADVKASSLSPKPPSYQYQLQVRPSEESFRVVVPQSKSTDSLAKTTATSRPPVVVSSIQVLVHTPAKPALVNKIDRHEARKAPSSRSPTPQPSIGSFHETRSRRGVAVAPTPTRLPKQTQPPSYPEPFPAPPPYRASPEEKSSLHSGRSRSLPRSRKHSSRSALEKEAPLPALPDHPQLSASAVSRIQAAYKVSNEFGTAVMRQEVRLAIPSPEHMDPVPVPTPRAAARHFMSAAELNNHRKAKQWEHEARQRTMSKPSFSVERPSGHSRQRATSAANLGRGNHDMKSRITANDGR